jgi:hypothetical protein
MTFKELEWKKVKDLLSPYMEFKTQGGWIIGHLNHSISNYNYTMFTYFGEHIMGVNYIKDFNELGWDFEVCKNFFDVRRLLPKIKNTFLELKFPGYHEKLKRIQDDC